MFLKELVVIMSLAKEVVYFKQKDTKRKTIFFPLLVTRSIAVVARVQFLKMTAKYCSLI